MSWMPLEEPRAPIGGTPFPVAKIAASAFASGAVGTPTPLANAKLYPHRPSLTLARAYAFAYVTATAGVAYRPKCELCSRSDSGSHPA